MTPSSSPSSDAPPTDATFSAAASPPATPQRRRRWRRWALWITLPAAGAWVAWGVHSADMALWRRPPPRPAIIEAPPPAPPVGGKSIAPPSARLNAPRLDPSRLEPGAPPSQPPSPPPSLLEDRALEDSAVSTARLDALEVGVLKTEALTNRIAALEQRLRKVETTNATATNSLALLVIASQIDNRVRRGAPYDAYLLLARASASRNPAATAALDALKPWARSGAPTRTALARRFAALAADGARATSSANADWIEASLDNLRQLFTVRRTGGGPDAAPLSQAEVAFAHDDLAGAATALAPLALGSTTVNALLVDIRAVLAAEEAAQTLLALAASAFFDPETSAATALADPFGPN